MNLRMKYVRLSAAAALAFLFLMLSEVRGRLEDTVATFTELRAKEKSLMTTDEISYKKKTLLIEREHLTALRRQKLPAIDQNESGLFRYLTVVASEERITIESFSPSEMKHENGMTQVAFALNFTSDFHKVAAYVNSIETGSYPVAITRLSIESDPAGNPALKVSLSGRARLLSNSFEASLK